MKILHVVPDAPPSGVIRELDLLLKAPWRTEADTRVCCLGAEGLASQACRAAGVVVHVLQWRRQLDPRPLWRLAKLIREFNPDCIHVWGLGALRALRLAAPRTKATVAVRLPLSLGNCPDSLCLLDRWLLRGADRVLVGTGAEAARCNAIGLPNDKLTFVRRPAMAFEPVTRKPGPPLILCMGALLQSNGFFEALWTFDILHFANPEWEFAVAGEGPERRRLEQFMAGAGLQQRVHLPGETELAPWLGRASVVWVPSLKDNGTSAAVDAMAAGLPVVASRWPSLTELVVDGVTGTLVEPGNKMELARKTVRLLEDWELRRRLSEAGRQMVEQLYSPNSFAQTWSRALGREKPPCPSKAPTMIAA